ncbi:MAG: alpha/beta hydrolase-fold protein [Imperialibacter sp.]|uniref:alpha/beta hydrolase-fold protein n=1 Tax=Imperialibacter sp. TaxID=2038411 RepID=UPI0032EF768E
MQLKRCLDNLFPLFLLIFVFAVSSCSDKEQANTPPPKPVLNFGISIDKKFTDGPFDGRILLVIAKTNDPEPRFQISDGPSSQMIFGITVDQLQAGTEVVVDSAVFGYPVQSIKNIPPGDYYIQGFLNKYTTFNLANGHTVKLHMDQGEGQQWASSPKNLFSTPQKVTINPATGGNFKISLTNEIPPIPDPVDTKYIKHVKIESKLLSEFWGRPMYLGANILLPHDWDKQPDARYPLMVFHGHFPYTFGGFSETPPDPNLKADYSERFKIEGYNKIVQQEAYDLYKQWTGPRFPRYIAIEIQHQNPYYDDSYAVNSANLGPYGDAITYELLPYIEEQFNGIGEGWGRFLYGGSTGGWEALAAQVFYPDEYNGCFAACPDPIDFRAYTVVNLYEDENAYYLDNDYNKTLRPGHRDYLGHVQSTIQESNHKELVIGGRESRSGDQWDIWQAVYSPTGANGYPRPIWDKMTGVIDKEVANYWKENYDLSHIMKRDWAKIGKKLEGKVHIYCGDMDNYYLNNAVYLTEEFLESTTDPYYGGEVDYGDRAEHCWNGDQENPNYISRLRYNTMYLPKIKERLRKTKPRGFRLINWGI